MCVYHERGADEHATMQCARPRACKQESKNALTFSKVIKESVFIGGVFFNKDLELGIVNQSQVGWQHGDGFGCLHTRVRACVW